MRALAICGMLFAALAWSCPLAIEPADSSVGASCGEDRDCAVGYCDKKYTGGYCTQPCDTQPCPTGARCVELVIPLAPRLAFCHRSCVRHEDCGRPGYVCMVPYDQGDTVCMPASP